MTDRARLAAYECVRAVDQDGAYANLAMPGILAERRLDGRDAAFATELAYGALRMRMFYDAVIGAAARRRPDAIDPDVRRALWLGAHQALAMRVPAHAAASETVDLVRSVAGKGAAGFANAVMRRVLERDRDAWEARVAPGTGRAARAVRFSHPEWVVAELDAALAADGRAGEGDALLASDNEAAHVTLAARPGLIDVESLAKSANGTPTKLSPWGVTVGSGRPGDLADVTAGRAGVQDEGSQLAALALVGAAPIATGERWLDLCAGPGGKAAILAGIAAQHGVTLDALELHPHRAALVERALRAIPAGTATVHVGDGRTWGTAATYDRVLLDAPCTGLGALRRRPEARWRREQADVPALVSLQRALLARALELVTPGGVVAYVTCSPVLAETRDVVAAAGVRSLDTPAAMAAATGADAPTFGRGPHVQLWPHAHGTDAMFTALLQAPSQ